MQRIRDKLMSVGSVQDMSLTTISETDHDMLPRSTSAVVDEPYTAPPPDRVRSLLLSWMHVNGSCTMEIRLNCMLPILNRSQLAGPTEQDASPRDCDQTNLRVPAEQELGNRPLRSQSKPSSGGRVSGKACGGF